MISTGNVELVEVVWVAITGIASAVTAWVMWDAWRDWRAVLRDPQLDGMAELAARGSTRAEAIRLLQLAFLTSIGIVSLFAHPAPPECVTTYGNFVAAGLVLSAVCLLTNTIMGFKSRRKLLFLISMKEEAATQ